MYVLGMRVCVRKRPIFPHELTQGEYDVVTCVLRRGAAQVVVHDAHMLQCVAVWCSVL